MHQPSKVRLQARHAAAQPTAAAAAGCSCWSIRDAAVGSDQGVAATWVQNAVLASVSFTAAAAAVAAAATAVTTAATVASAALSAEAKCWYGWFWLLWLLLWLGLIQSPPVLYSLFMPNYKLILLMHNLVLLLLLLLLLLSLKQLLL
jgi:hypothetical protein